MRALITTHARPLLLLLLQLLQPLQFLWINDMSGIPEDEREEYAEYLEILYGTRPTRPPSIEKFKRINIVDPLGRPFYDDDYCTDEMRANIIHSKFRCLQEHYFLTMQYEELKNICLNKFVPCKNGIKKCKMSTTLEGGLYCKLIEGTRMPECIYEPEYRSGYVLITCRWHNETQEFIPESVNDIVTPPE
ncbi:inactive ribonuclease-like protein 9 [Cynocephalus volans]|uniref:inactive ribonuclease-like protein 9 n=1 Tax=Cynocephalus volans TaxID=110931 RepID=UPI002FC7F605